MKTLLEYLKNILNENKVDDEYQKSFSDIDRDIFNKIVLMDPKTKVEGNEIVNIGFLAKQLLLPNYKKGETNFIDKEEEVKNALNNYAPNISKYPKPNEFKSVSDFLRFMEDPENTEIEKAEKENPIDVIYNKYYSAIPRDDFNKIIQMDPNTKADKIGEICKNLLLPKYIAGDKSFINDPDRVQTACIFYYGEKDTLPQEKQQLSSYSSVDSFINYLLQGPDSNLWTSLKNNDTIDSDTNRPVKDDVRLIASTREYDIIEPLSHAANNAISGGSNNNAWCTGYGRNWWHQYTDNGGRIFCFMHKRDNRGTENRIKNWQIQVLNNKIPYRAFLNGADSISGYKGKTTEDEFKNFLLAHMDIYEAIKDKDPFNNLVPVQQVAEIKQSSSKPYFIESESDLNKFYILDDSTKLGIKQLHVSNINKIPVTFMPGNNILKEVIIGDGVKEIGDQAFKNCMQLQKVTLGKDLEKIGKEAFAGCKLLRTSVRLPNSLTEIGQKAFYDTHCNLKLDINRQNEIYFDSKDYDWVISHVEGIKVQGDE